MTKLPSLDAIDFSQSDGSFSFRENNYHFKKYLDIYFFKNETDSSYNYIYSLPIYSDYLIEQFRQCSQQEIEEFLQKGVNIYRCVQYNETIFRFAECGIGEYYSIKYEWWQEFNWKCFRYMCFDEWLKKPDDFFISQAELVYQKEIPLIECRVSFSNYKSETTKPIEFVCGSKSELERLTQVAAFTLAELQHLFKQSSGFTVIYSSENDYNTGGVFPGVTIGQEYHAFSKQAKQLLNLIFEYNFFTGLYWEYTDGYPDYTRGYLPCPHELEIEIPHPSEHEKIEAALELQEWLQGKLPDKDIKSYFEEQNSADTNYIENQQQTQENCDFEENNYQPPNTKEIQNQDVDEYF